MLPLLVSKLVFFPGIDSCNLLSAEALHTGDAQYEPNR